MARIEARIRVQKPEDKSIDHRERSKSPPRIPTISLSGHSPAVFFLRGERRTAMETKEKADSPDKDAETKRRGRGMEEEEEEEKKGKVIEPTGKTRVSW